MHKEINIKEIEDKILNPLNEILLLAYGTQIYYQILMDIERIVKELEKQHLINKRWQ